MAKTVADIAVQLGFDIGPLIAGAAKAQAVMTRFEANMKRAGAGLESVGSAATRAGKTMTLVTGAIVAAGGAMFALAKQGADLGDAIDNASKAAGMAPGYYQEMAFAIGQVADVSSDDFATAMAKLNTTLGQAQQGSGSAIAAFKAIGISQADLASGAVDSEDALNALVKTLGETTDPAIAAAITADLLGKTGGRMGSLLAGASGEVSNLREKARSLGVVMSDEAVKAAGEFNDKWEALGKQFEAVKMKIADVLLPVIVNDLIPALQEKVIPAIIAVIGKVGEWIDWFDKLPQPVKDFASTIAIAFAAGGPVLLAIGAVATAIGVLVSGPAAPIVLLAAAAGVLSAAWLAWGDDFKAAILPVLDTVTGAFNNFMTLLDTIITKLSAWKSAAADFIGAGDPSTFTPNPDYVPDPMSNLGSGQLPSEGVTGPVGAGAAVADGLANGMIDQLGTRTPDITGAVDAMTQTVRDQLGIHSPSTVFAEIGRNIGDGFAEGIASRQAVIRAQMEHMGGISVETMQSYASQSLDILSTLFQGSKAIAAAQAFVNAWAGATEALKLPFPANLFAFGKVLATGMAAVSAIKGASVGGGGSTSAPAASAAVPTGPAGVANVQLVGDVFSKASVEDLFSQINSGLRSGYQINLV